MDRGDIIAALALWGVERVGDRGFKLLVDSFGGPAEALLASPAAVASICGFRSAPENFASARNVARAEKILDEAQKKGFSVARYGGQGYPERLLTLYDPPALLFWEGDISLPALCVAIVGSRRATPHGLSLAKRIAADLAGAGVAVISGMAEGIDAAAHEGALAGGGKTAAVLGCGPDICYPRSNEGLKRRIVEAGGAVLSEHPPSTEPISAHFPKRNRVISGLAEGVLVVEAAVKSGSLITARLALEQGKEVFATPGLAGSPHAKGVNGLIKSGAALVESAEDILAEFGVAFERKNIEEKPAPRISKEASAVLGALFDAPDDSDAIAARSGLSSGAVSAALMELSLLGLAEQWPGNRFSKRNN